MAIDMLDYKLIYDKEYIAHLSNLRDDMANLKEISFDDLSEERKQQINEVTKEINRIKADTRF
jgi:hypothetical protein